jgi:SHS2 domain-containing protein
MRPAEGMVTDAEHGPSPRGHRSLPHTGDLCVEAWAPTREECIAEAGWGMVGSFADLPAGASGATRECVVSAEDDGRLLAAVLEEVIYRYRMDTVGELPVDIAVTPAPGGVRLRFTMTGSSAATQIGAVPKAVSVPSPIPRRRRPSGPDDFDAWVCRTVLNPRIPLFLEAHHPIQEETDHWDRALCHSALAAIASGCSTQGEIAECLGTPLTDASHCLALLQANGLLYSEPDAFRPNRVRLRIAEPLLAFEHAAVWPHRSALAQQDAVAV